MGKKTAHVSKPAYYVPSLEPPPPKVKKVSRKFVKKAALNANKQLDNKQKARAGLKVNRAQDRFKKGKGKKGNKKGGKK